MKLEFSLYILEKRWNMKFHENPSSWKQKCSHADGQTDTQADMTNLIVAFCNFTKAPIKNNHTFR